MINAASISIDIAEVWGSWICCRFVTCHVSFHKTWDIETFLKKRVGLHLTLRNVKILFSNSTTTRARLALPFCLNMGAKMYFYGRFLINFAQGLVLFLPVADWINVASRRVVEKADVSGLMLVSWWTRGHQTVSMVLYKIIQKTFFSNENACC